MKSVVSQVEMGRGMPMEIRLKETRHRPGRRVGSWLILVVGGWEAGRCSSRVHLVVVALWVGLVGWMGGLDVKCKEMCLVKKW